MSHIPYYGEDRDPLAVPPRPDHLSECKARRPAARAPERADR